MLFLTVFLILSRGAASLGFYYDDSGFLLQLPRIHSLAELWKNIRNYVPGRNLHVIWQFLFFWPFKNPVDHLPALHYVQSAVDAANAVLLYFVLRRLKLSSAASLTSAALFAFWPFHGETHFWMSALPMNIVSTAFLLTFILTSVSLLEGSKARWIYILDVTSCWCAMLTYDQTLGPLLLIVAVRITHVFFYKSPDWRLLTAINLVNASAAGFFFWLRLNVLLAGVPMPFQQTDFWREILENFLSSIRMNFGRVGYEHVWKLVLRATESDRIFAIASAIAILLVALWLLKERPHANGGAHAWLFGLAALFWVLAYFPVWMWFPAARHHFLPTVGLFCAVAIVLHWIQSVSRFRILAAIPHVGLAAIVMMSAVASRGESRCWEEAFLAKRRLMADLRSSLAGKTGLVLEGFPNSDGPAMLITPHDAGFAPRLLLPELSLPRTFRGTLKARREGGRIAFDPESTVPGPPPKAQAADDTLWLHFEGLENGVLRYSERDLSSRFPEAR